MLSLFWSTLSPEVVCACTEFGASPVPQSAIEEDAVEDYDEAHALMSVSEFERATRERALTNSLTLTNYEQERRTRTWEEAETSVRLLVSVTNHRAKVGRGPATSGQRGYALRLKCETSTRMLAGLDEAQRESEHGVTYEEALTPMPATRSNRGPAAVEQQIQRKKVLIGEMEWLSAAVKAETPNGGESKDESKDDEESLPSERPRLSSTTLNKSRTSSTPANEPALLSSDYGDEIELKYCNTNSDGKGQLDSPTRLGRLSAANTRLI